MQNQRRGREGEAVTRIHVGRVRPLKGSDKHVLRWRRSQMMPRPCEIERHCRFVLRVLSDQCSCGNIVCLRLACDECCECWMYEWSMFRRLGARGPHLSQLPANSKPQGFKSEWHFAQPCARQRSLIVPHERFFWRKHRQWRGGPHQAIRITNGVAVCQGIASLMLPSRCGSTALVTGGTDFCGTR